ncbi:LysR family transcriptional regulator [Parathalassolituus penaei]|uniref:LysR substrate-binding domain-containing protein n=1 Tax=Parathalassolituus penaei TaxID=2997323 RepID=A0A9X3ECK2_9GAMM|nr:LysR family transcriptional regulator [Parathalassolituus penaei]MCY0965099.1 LysR substrate-binding domain-containing protein [Parathalassolituus penaei]
MDTLTNLKTFLAVSSHGNFTSAARSLHVVPSVVAKRIAQLESTLGNRLFDRTTRTLELTDAGQRLLPSARQCLTEFEGLLQQAAMDDSKLEGHLRLMLPTTISMAALSRSVTRFMAQHPRITVETLMSDRSVSPLEENIDVMISGRLAHYDGVVQVPLAPTLVGLFAAPEYLEQYGRPEHPSQLVDHSCLVFSPQGKTWAFESSKGPVYVDVQPRLSSDDNYTLCVGAEQSLGLAILPGYIARDGVQSGRLVKVMTAYPPQDRWYRAHIPKRNENLARVTALCKWLRQDIEALNSGLSPSPAGKQF